MNLLDLAPADADGIVRHWLESRGEQPFRLRQILPRLWQRPAASWRDATELPKELVAALEVEFPLPRLALDTRRVSTDGTVKFLWRLGDRSAIESVLIPEARRRTLCISSQAGCAFGCVFCATGRMGFERHLAPWEIAGQVRELALDPTLGKLTNVVFMGMGEPLHNWPAVDRALTILNDPRGLGIGARHITVSTVGILPALARLAARPEQFRLAVSLHAATSERRIALMPVERKYGLAELLPALRAFGRRVTLEYVMIQGANDTPADADALADIAAPLGALVNLLPLHPGGGTALLPTPPAGIRRFAKRLEGRGVSVTVRRSRGLDIEAACGQLRTLADGSRRVRSQQNGDVQEPVGIGLNHDPAPAEELADRPGGGGIASPDQNAG